VWAKSSAMRLSRVRRKSMGGSRVRGSQTRVL
jgi:hypothetical protein